MKLFQNQQRIIEECEAHTANTAEGRRQPQTKGISAGMEELARIVHGYDELEKIVRSGYDEQTMTSEQRQKFIDECEERIAENERERQRILDQIGGLEAAGAPSKKQKQRMRDLARTRRWRKERWRLEKEMQKKTEEHCQAGIPPAMRRHYHGIATACLRHMPDGPDTRTASPAPAPCAG